MYSFQFQHAVTSQQLGPHC